MSTILLGRPFRVTSGPLLIAVTVCASAAFAARVATNLAEGRIDRMALGRPTHSVEPPAPAVTPPVEAGDHGAGLIARNMFCSTCVGGGGPGDPEPPPADGRPLPRLIATHVGAGGGGWATLLDATSGIGGAFAVGGVVPGGATLVTVERGSASVRFSDGAVARIALAVGGEVAKEPSRSGIGTGQKVSDDPWADRVRMVGTDRYEVDRGLIRELMGSGAGGSVKGVRVVPVTKDGQFVGLRLATARDGSLAHALGLAQGDVIDSIDGRPVNPDMLMELYGRMGDLQQVKIGVDRKGTKKTLGYDLR